MSDEYKFKVGDRIKFIKGSLSYLFIMKYYESFYIDPMSSATIVSMRKSGKYEFKNTNVYKIVLAYRSKYHRNDVYTTNIESYENEIEFNEDEDEEDLYV